MNSNKLTNSQSIHNVQCALQFVWLCQVHRIAKFCCAEQLRETYNTTLHECVCVCAFEGIWKYGVRLNLMKSFHELCDHRNMAKFARPPSVCTGKIFSTFNSLRLCAAGWKADLSWVELSFKAQKIDMG